MEKLFYIEMGPSNSSPREDQKCRKVSDGMSSSCSTSSATSDTIAMARRDGNEVFLACLDQTACIHYQDKPFEPIHGMLYSTV